MYTTYFTVRGRGAFPLDMLRRDSCFPASQRDVEKLVWDEEERSVTLQTNHRYRNGGRPNEHRWRSFSWTVVHVDSTIKLG